MNLLCMICNSLKKKNGFHISHGRILRRSVRVNVKKTRLLLQSDLAPASMGLSASFRYGSSVSNKLATRYSPDKSTTQVCARKDSLCYRPMCLPWEEAMGHFWLFDSCRQQNVTDNWPWGEMSYPEVDLMTKLLSNGSTTKTMQKTYHLEWLYYYYYPVVLENQPVDAKLEK